MFDLLKFMAEQIVKLVPHIRAVREEDKRIAVGARLFFAYMSLNYLLEGGRDLIRHLEWAERVAADSNASESFSLWRNGLSEAIERQMFQISECSRKLEEIAGPLYLIAPEAARSIVSMLNHKQSAVHLLRETIFPAPTAKEIGTPLLPLIGPMEALDQALKFRQGDLFEFKAEVPSSTLEAMLREGGFIDWHLYQDATRIMKSAILTPHVSPGEFRRSVAMYISTRNPERALDELEASLRLLHQAILSNFSVAELILPVGDPHFK